jgi:hypothetical protein
MIRVLKKSSLRPRVRCLDNEGVYLLAHSDLPLLCTLAKKRIHWSSNMPPGQLGEIEGRATV